jgi:hypothetical protein
VILLWYLLEMIRQFRLQNATEVAFCCCAGLGFCPAPILFSRHHNLLNTKGPHGKRKTAIKRRVKTCADWYKLVPLPKNTCENANMGQFNLFMANKKGVGSIKIPFGNLFS